MFREVKQTTLYEAVTLFYLVRIVLLSPFQDSGLVVRSPGLKGLWNFNLCENMCGGQLRNKFNLSTSEGHLRFQSETFMAGESKE